jgi:hypothetical protein
MNPTITEPPMEPTGVDNTQPVPSAEPAATSLQPTPTSQEPAQVATGVDPEYTAWLESKKLDGTSENAFEQAAKMAYNSEKLMTKATQEASELKKSLTGPEPVAQGQDPGMGEFIADYKRDKMIGSFKESHADWKEQEPKMAELLTQQVNTPDGTYTRSQLVNAGYIALEDVYSMAKGSSPDTEAIKSGAKQEVLQQLANTQRAGGASPNASQSNPQAPNADTALDAFKRGMAG